MKLFALMDEKIILEFDLDGIALDLGVIKNLDQELVRHGQILEVLGTRHHDASGFKDADRHVEHLGFHGRVGFWVERNFLHVLAMLLV